MFSVSSPSNGSLEASIDGYAGNVIACCGSSLIPYLIGLSSSVISLAVAFCVSVKGSKNF